MDFYVLTYPATLLKSLIRYSIFLVSSLEFAIYSMSSADRLNYNIVGNIKWTIFVLIVFDCCFVCMDFYGCLLLPSGFLSLW